MSNRHGRPMAEPTSPTEDVGCGAGLLEHIWADRDGLIRIPGGLGVIWDCAARLRRAAQLRAWLVERIAADTTLRDSLPVEALWWARFDLLGRAPSNLRPLDAETWPRA